jgi:hypothetical protein
MESQNKQVYYAPEPLFRAIDSKIINGNFLVTLYGSIEMGEAEPWQEWIIKDCKDITKLIFLNPRRVFWNKEVEQSKNNPEFSEQVGWELTAGQYSDLNVFYFDPSTKSPITLMELGISAAKFPEKTVVCCPEGYWRKGNVDVTCEYFNVKQVESIRELTNYIKLKAKV